MFLSVHHGRNGVNDLLMPAAPSAKNPMIVVAAALIAADGSILVQRRREAADHGGLWEFPGGKCEEGEPLRDALARELAEELAIACEPGDFEATAFALVPHRAGEMLLLLFECRRWAGDPRPLDAQELRWCRPADLPELAMPPADIPLAVELARRAR